MLLWLLSVLPVLLFLLKYAEYFQKKPVFGIYQQPGVFYPLKFLFMFFVLAFRKLRSNKSKDSSDIVTDDTFLIDNDALYDFPQQLHNHPKAIDAVYFNGVSENDEVLICGIARRPEGICNGFLYLKVKDGELLLSPKLPDTTLRQLSDEIGQYSVEGLKLETVIPMKEWKISYNGVMSPQSNPEKIITVELEATWKANWKHFNYDTDMSATSMAKDIAREPWSSEYFNILKEVHQTHYEQYGTIQGTVKIDDVYHSLKADSVRDHSFGKFREWKNFHRYGLHFLHLANGDCLTVGRICMPVCFSKLTIGFLCCKEDGEIYPVDECDLELYHMGENLTPPLDYAFQFKAGGVKYTVQIDVVNSPSFYIGNEHECRIDERLVRCKVNGIEGWGAAEWQYRNLNKDIIKINKNQIIFGNFYID